jgi:hypothetical protein
MATKKPLMLDKYARDPKAWKAFADHNYAASVHLFESHNPFLIFNAATLGHHCLEMYLKAALICEGCAVFDPKKVKDKKATPTILAAFLHAMRGLRIPRTAYFDWDKKQADADAQGEKSE